MSPSPAGPGERFDRWVVSGPFTSRDLGIYRILYAASALLLLPRPESYSGLPDVLWSPPPGPFALIDHPPAYGLLLAITIVEAFALGLLLVGLFTRTSSVVAGLTFVLGDGFSNSYGTIYHYVLLGVVPLVLAWSGWGLRYSLDARRLAAPPDRVPQWPLRLLALAIGVAFATAGIAKLRSGWLDTSTQSARGHFLSGYLTQGRDLGLAAPFARLDSHLAWEALDWATVALELAVLVAVVSWTWFRRVLLVVVSFHLVVLLVLNIAFAANVVAYGAFVRWSGHLPDRAPVRPATPVVLLGLVAAAATGLVVTGVVTPRGDFWIRAAFVVLAAVVAVGVSVRPRAPRSSSG